MNVQPVLLPGNMCDARLWRGSEDRLVAALSAHGFLPPVDADLTQDDTITGMARRALSATNGRILPIGFSMGAIVAVEMWCLAPDRIAGLVLLGYNATGDLPHRAAHRPDQQAEVLTGGLERVLVEELKPNYLAAAHRTDPQLLALLHDMGMALGPDVFVRQSEALRLRNSRVEDLSRITVPVLLGCGAEDALCPPEWHADWARRIPDARTAIIAGAGHMLPLESPTELAGAVDRWLTEKEIA